MTKTNQKSTKLVILLDAWQPIVGGGQQLFLQAGRIGPGTVRAGRQEAADHKAVDGLGWIGGGQAQHTHPAACLVEPVPHGPGPAAAGNNYP